MTARPGSRGKSSRGVAERPDATPLRPGRERSAGLSLLELLAVVAILAIVAAGALTFADRAEEAELEKLAEVQLLRAAEAVRRFHADTGHLPGQGPFALVTDVPAGRVAVPAEGAAWFHCPANLVQLFEQPIGGAGAVLAFDPDTGRGWRGPYLLGGAQGLVTVGDGLAPDGSGSPTAGAPLPAVPALSDPFRHEPAGAFLAWREPATGRELRLGRPIFWLDLHDPASARLVSLGRDGIYQSQPAGAAASSSDDLVLPILR